MAVLRPRGAGLSPVAAAVALVALWCPSSQATRAAGEAGMIQGRVHLVTPSSRRLASAGAYPGRSVELAADHNASELANVVVFVRTRPTAAPPMSASIAQVDEEFVPHLVAVTVGSTVEFPNEDVVFHNVFSLSRAGTFDLGRYPKGRSKTRTFDRAGIVKVFCHIHSQMSAIIRVFDHPYFAIPDAAGHFTIASVPAGRYEVVAWHERVGEVALQARVEAGAPAVLSFSLPLAEDP